MMSYVTTLREVFRVLTAAERRSALGLLGWMGLGMMLETVGVGLVLPVLFFLSHSLPSAENAFFEGLMGALGNPSQAKTAVGAMLALIGVYTLKGAFMAVLAWRRARFAYSTQATLSERLFALYLRQPWSFHLRRNSAQMIRNAVTETKEFTSLGLLAGMTLVSEVLVLIGVGCLILWLEPVAALTVICVLSVFAYGFNRLTRVAISRWGTDRLNHEGFRVQHLQEGLGGAKDVKLLGREEDFITRYRFHNDGSSRVSQRYYTLQEMPRLAVELMGVLGLTGLVIVLVARGRPLEAVVPTVGLFAAAAFRVMPSVNRIVNCLQSLRYVQPVLENLHGDLALEPRTELSGVAQPVKPLAFNNILELKGVSYRYPGSNSPALRAVTVSIPRGSSVGIVGSSGGGKSTLIDVILGLLPPEEGSVLVDGVDISANLRAWQDQIGYVPQAIFLSDDTLRRNVAFGLADGDIDDAAVGRALRAAQLETLVEESRDGVELLVGERGVRLSGGQRQRIGVARALYHDPAVLVLDEATSALDGETEEELMGAVRALHGSKTIIIVAHRLSTVAHCDQLFRVEKGSVSVSHVA